MESLSKEQLFNTAESIKREMGFYPKGDIDDAVLVALVAHEGDRWGDCPYSKHLDLVEKEIYSKNNLLRKNNNVTKVKELFIKPERLKKLAWLHDVVEDHPDFLILVNKMFPTLVKNVLEISRNNNESYNDYIDRVAFVDYSLTADLQPEDFLSKFETMFIKFCDLSVNLQNNPPDRLKYRYIPALEKIQRSLIKLADHIVFNEYDYNNFRK